MKERKIRFNFIDVLIILLIAVIIFGALYVFVFRNRNTNLTEETSYTSIRYVVQVTNVDERFEDMINVGDHAEEAITRRTVGTVIGVQSEPYKKITFDYENAIETVSEVEGKLTMNVTIEANATETDSAFNVNGCAIRVGELYSIALPDMYISGYCIELTAESQK